MTNVNLTGKKTKIITTASVDFEVNSELFASANETLAKSIVRSIANDDPSFCNSELFNTYRIDLSDASEATYARLFESMRRADISSESIIEDAITYQENDGKKLTEQEKLEIAQQIKLEERNSAMCDFLNGENWIDSDYSSADAYYLEETYTEENDVFEAVINAIESLDADFEIDQEIFEEDFETAFRQAMVELMFEKDTSSYLDLIPYDKVELNFVKGFNWHESDLESGHLYQGELNDEILPLFEMANISPKSLYEFIEKKNLEANGDYDLDYFKPLLELSFEKNEAFEPYLKTSDLLTIIEEQYLYSMPMFTAYVELRELLSTDFSKGAYFSNGLIGMEDCINGAGYNESIEKTNGGFFISKDEFYNNVTLYCGINRFHTYTRKQVYDFYIPSVKTSIKEAK